MSVCPFKYDIVYEMIRQVTEADFSKEAFRKEAKQLLDLFDQWRNSNHYRAAQKSCEFYFKYDKVYHYLLDDDEQDIFIKIVFEEDYRRKHYFTEKDEEKFENWQDQLIPDDYFDRR